MLNLEVVKYAEKAMATHSSVLAWRIPQMRDPGGLPSMGSQRVGNDWSDLTAAAAVKYDFIYTLSLSIKVDKWGITITT